MGTEGNPIESVDVESVDVESVDSVIAMPNRPVPAWTPTEDLLCR